MNGLNYFKLMQIIWNDLHSANLASNIRLPNCIHWNKAIAYAQQHILTSSTSSISLLLYKRILLGAGWYTTLLLPAFLAVGGFTTEAAQFCADRGIGLAGPITYQATPA